MATTIDQLEVKIKTDSSGAAAGIDALVVSLEKLKKIGSFGKAVTNLNNLAGALRNISGVSSATRTLGALAGALERIKGVGTLKPLANSIPALATGLNKLGSLNIEELAPKIEGVAAAVRPLSEVKAGGINTMANGLLKLDKVTKSLDDDTINRFADRIQKLIDKLTPLSTRLTTIQAGLRAVNTNAQSAGAAIRNMGNNVNATALNMASFITIAQGVAQALEPVVRIIGEATYAAAEWDGIAARFGRGFGANAQETYDWIQRLNEEMGINVQQFMQYSSVYATMLTGFGVAMEDAGKMALGYTELTYDIWAGYNDIYKSFDEAAEAVKSAIAGEVEPIRRAGFTIVESTLEQTAANHGLDISLEKATESQKSYLRYLTLIDQAHAQSLVGTYAKELNTAEGLLRTFSQQLKSLAQAFGSLFLPVLVAVVPWLQAFVEVLTDAIRAVAAFFGIEIQAVDWSGYNDGSDAIGGVADSAEEAGGALGSAAKAAKDLKNATLGIDELNVISPPHASGGSGGSGGAAGGGAGFDGLDIDSLWDERIFDQIQSKVDEIKQKIEDWLPVIETIGGALAGLGIATLLKHIGEALEKMNLLQKIFATVAIVAIEAALVFTFADNYLESGNLLYLIGEALVTAAAGYLLFKAWGPKGAVLALGVSIAAQLAAITLNLADGSVEMDDPQLWIQSAFTTALAGAGGGWMAYKGLINVGVGKGVGLGLLAGLSLTLAAITIGDIAADGEVTKENIITAIGSVLSAAGFGFVVGGPTGALIGAAVGLAVNIVGAVVGSISADAEENLKKDLESRLGNVQVSVGEARVIINKLVPAWVEGVNQATELRKGVEALIKDIETQEGVLGSYEWQISVGLVLSESENKQYRAAIDSFITACQDYVSERGYAIEIGLSATSANSSIIESVNSISSMASEELDKLGKQLQETVNKAYEDGLLDIDELKAIQNIRNDMREIVNALSSSEIEAELEMLKLNWSGVSLTPDSFETMLSEWNDTIQNDVKPALESTVKENLKTLKGNIAYLELALEKDPDNASLKAELEKAKEAYQDYIDENPLENLTLEVNIQAVNFALNTLRDAFAKEIARVEEEGYLEYSNALEVVLNVMPGVKFDDGNGEIYGQIAGMVVQMQYAFEDASLSMSKEARKSLEGMLESMKPTMADFEEIAAENRKAGVTVTKSVRDGLNDYNELRALSGDIEGINYMIGKGFSTDPVFLNTLATAEGAGTDIDEYVAKGLLNNIDYVTDEATGLVVGIKDAITGETVHITPILEQNLSDIGVNLGDALGGKYQYVYDETTGVLKSIVDSANGNEVWVNSELKEAGQNAGSELSAGVLSGAESEMLAEKKSWLDWAIWPWNWFKEKNEINSPSKLFQRGGEYLVGGLKKGLSVTALRDSLSDMWSNAKNWWNGKKDLSVAKVDVSLVKKGWSTVKGWIGNLPTLSQAIKLAKSGWSSVKKWIGGIPAVSQGVKLAKSGWSSVKKWVGTIPTMSAPIKLVKSGWSSVKKWLGNLNFDLKFKLPKIGVKWGSKEVLGFKISYPSSFYTYAKGGFPDLGELFIAREAGPEMVGRIGNKTTVVNNEQIVEGISEGVYAAVLAAMRASEGNGERAVNVYLDGRQIAASVERTQRDRGATIMGKQVLAF